MDNTPRHDSYASFVAVALRRHLALVLACALIGLALAGGYVATRHVSYTAAAKVLPAPLVGNPLGPDVSSSNTTQFIVAMQTEAGLVGTDGVAKLASKAPNTPLPLNVNHVSASVPPNSGLIKIAYTAGAAKSAQDGAQAFATGFLKYRQSQAVAYKARTVAGLTSEVSQTSKALSEATADLSKTKNPGPAEQQHVQNLTTRLDTLNSNLSDAQALSTFPGRVVSNATLPTSPDGVKPPLLLIAGLILGLIIGMALALWRESRRDVVDSGVDDDVFGVPLLARLPAEAVDSGRLISAEAGGDPGQEAYRRLRASLVASASPPRVVSVSSVGSAGSVGVVAINLGVSLARAGFRVTVVVADAEDEQAPTALGAAQSPGLADILTGACSIDECVQASNGIRFVAAGPDLSDVRELLAGPATRRVLAGVSDGADYVLVPTAQCMTADADAVAMACQGAVVVVRDGVTTHAEATSAVHRLERLGVTTLGAASVERGGNRRKQSSRSEPGQPTERDDDAEVQTRSSAGDSREEPRVGTDA